MWRVIGQATMARMRMDGQLMVTRAIVLPMKLPLATGVLSGSLLRPSAAEPRMLRVDRVFDRTQPTPPADEPSSSSYVAAQPVDRWQVLLRGSSVVLTEIGGRELRLEGREESSRDGTRRFAFGDGALGRTGRFVLHPDDTAEVIIFGSGVRVVQSERGRLVSL